ncbi:MAG: hypothetical protein MJZ12_03130 [Prevotella sp.]|nr:hypothetical protein [Prevotella sp.]
MKKLTILSIFSVILFSLFSCTLNMEEYIVPEEEKGFDKPVVEETEMGTIKYQFQDNVQVLTERVQKYIADVREDSIIYFMDNLPDEWMPQVGNCLFGKITRMLPYGMSAKVLAVSREGGLIKVVTTNVPDTEVFKQKIVDIDCDYVLQNLANRDKEGSNITTLNDSVVVDWSYNDGELPDYAVAADTSGIGTRAIEPYDKIEDNSYSISIETPEWGFGGVAGLQGKATVTFVTKKRLHYYEELGVKREEWSIDESYEKIELEVKMKGTEGGSSDNISWAQLKEKNPSFKNFIDHCVSSNKDKSFMKDGFLEISTNLPKLHIPLGGICYFEFSLDGSLTITPSMYGHVTGIIYHQQKREGESVYYASNGEEYHANFKGDKIIKEGGFEVTDAEIVGELSMTVGLYVGVEVGVGLGGANTKFGIGLKVTAGLEFTAGVKGGVGANWHSGDHITFVPIVDYYVTLTFNVSVSSCLTLWKKECNITIWEMEPKKIVDLTIHTTPHLSSSKSNVRYQSYYEQAFSYTSQEPVQCLEVNMVFRNVFSSIWSKSAEHVKYLKARVYANDPESGIYVDLYPTNNDYQYPDFYQKDAVTAKVSQNYKFVVPVTTLHEKLGNYKSLIVVPVFWGNNTPEELIISEETMSLSSKTPAVGTILSELLYAGPSGIPSEPYKYKFILMTKFENTQEVNSIGYRIAVKTYFGTTLFNEDIYVRKNTIVPSGFYRTYFTFTSNVKSGVMNGGDEDLFITATPFYNLITGKRKESESRQAKFELEYPVEDHDPSLMFKLGDYDNYINL